MSKPTPDDADRIFSSAAEGSDPLVAFVRDMRETFSRAPDGATQARHLRAMAGEFTTRPAAAQARKRRLPVGRAAAAALVGSLLVTGSALAATGHLPDAAQNAISDAAKAVGLTIPGPHGNGKSHGDAGKARAADNRARAKAFTDAKKTWTECVAEKASEHSGSSGPFDPEAACGPKPNPQDFRSAPAGPTGPTDHGNGNNGNDNGNHGQPATQNHGHGNGQAPDTPGGPPFPNPGANSGHGGNPHSGHTGSE